MFENGEGGVSGRSGERDQHEHMSVLCDLITRGKMVVMMTVSNLNSRLAVDVKALDTMNDLLHGGARCLMLQRAGGGVRWQIRLRGGLSGDHFQWRSASIQVDAG